MGRFLKFLLYLLLGLLSVVILSLLAIYQITESRIDKRYSVRAEAIPIPTDQASIDRGRHLATSVFMCVGCHGNDLSGESFDDGPLVGRIVMDNLTMGEGGLAGEYTTEDWVRAVRYGVDRQGKSLLIMPSQLYYPISDEDLGMMIAYIRSSPPVDNVLPEAYIGPLARFYLLQEPRMLSASAIEHAASRPVAPTPGVSPEYGEYLSQTCKDCHGMDYLGSLEAGAGLNLTPGGDLGRWTEADFIRAMRTGVTPEGKVLNPENMPYNYLGQMSDDELKAIWLYLQTLPPVEDQTQP